MSMWYDAPNRFMNGRALGSMNDQWREEKVTGAMRREPDQSLLRFGETIAAQLRSSSRVRRKSDGCD